MDRPIPERRLSEAPAATHPFPTWAHAGKDMVGTSLGSARLWFTVAEGILTETYYPRIDIPQIRDLGFIVENPAASEYRTATQFAQNDVLRDDFAVSVQDRATGILRLADDGRIAGTKQRVLHLLNNARQARLDDLQCNRINGHKTLHVN